jgi:L-ribulose-5-phosphate 3-epimerase
MSSKGLKMPQMIGVVVDDLRLDPKSGLLRASEMRFRAVELGATRGEIAPENLSTTGRRHLRRYVDGLGLTFQALGGDLGGARFSDSTRLDENLDRTRRILEMAADLRVPMVTAHIGDFDTEAPAPQRDRVVEAVRQIADYADRTGTVFAIETAGAGPEDLCALLKSIDCPLLKASLDPAELLVAGIDPVEAVEKLADNVALARARDALAGSRSRAGRETALGQGNLDLIGYLAALAASGYGGPAMLRRTDAAKPVEELATAKAFLESTLAR